MFQQQRRSGSGLNRTAPRQGATGALKALIEGGYAHGPGCDRLGQAERRPVG